MDVSEPPKARTDNRTSFGGALVLRGDGNISNAPPDAEAYVTLVSDRLEAADALGVSRYSVNQLVNGRRAVTAEMALLLARAFSTTPDFWLDLQRNLDLHRARRRLARRLDAVRILRGPLADDELFYDAPA